MSETTNGDKVFEMADGWWCTVDGVSYGPYESEDEAYSVVHAQAKPSRSGPKMR